MGLPTENLAAAERFRGHKGSILGSVDGSGQSLADSDISKRFGERMENEIRTALNDLNRD
jgi:hypothetical protein